MTHGHIQDSLNTVSDKSVHVIQKYALCGKILQRRLAANGLFIYHITTNVNTFMMQ